jgi:hypothetical protein
MKYNVSFIFSILLYVLGIIVGCTNPTKKVDETTGLPSNNIETSSNRSHSYKVISEEKMETSYKAQLIEYVWYKDTVYTEDALRNTILEIYNNNKDKNVFDTHDSPTVIATYLFTSKEAMKDKSEWIAMMIKGPNDTEPNVSYNRFKVTALNDLKDNIKSKDEIELDKLNAYLNERGLELCSLADQLKKLELDNIHKADAKYPDFGEEHMAMTERLDAQGYKKLRIKYRLSEDVFVKVSIFAGSYCK